MCVGVVMRRLWFQRTQTLLGEGSRRLSAGHEARQEDVRCRLDNTRHCTELTRADRRQDVCRRDRSTWYVRRTRRRVLLIVHSFSLAMFKATLQLIDLSKCLA